MCLFIYFIIIFYFFLDLSPYIIERKKQFVQMEYRIQRIEAEDVNRVRSIKLVVAENCIYMASRVSALRHSRQH